MTPRAPGDGQPVARVALCADCAAQLREFSLAASVHTAFTPAALLRLARFVGPARGRLTAAERREAFDLQLKLMDGFERAQGRGGLLRREGRGGAT